MRRFELYFRRKMEDETFRTLYGKECHVCAKTVQIFSKTEMEGISLESLADAAGVGIHVLEALRDADCCDPELVIQLCLHLGLSAPENCPQRGDD